MATVFFRGLDTQPGASPAGKAAIVFDLAVARRRRLFAEIARARAGSVVRRASAAIARDAATLALARPWPDPRIENRATLLVLQLWLEELRDWGQSLAGLDASLLQPIVAALADRSLELRHASSRNGLGTARLAALLREAADVLDHEARRLASPASRH